MQSSWRLPAYMSRSNASASAANFTVHNITVVLSLARNIRCRELDSGGHAW